MEDFNFPIDHIGIAVENIQTATELYQNSFGNKITLKETLLDRQIEVVFLSTGNTLIELISPTAEGKKDPNNSVQKFLTTRGEGLHHICYQVNDITSELEKLSSSGFKLIDQKPRSGAHGSLIAFLHPKSTRGVLIELCQHI